MPLSSSQRRDFKTLQRAFLAEDAALIECQLAATAEPMEPAATLNETRGFGDLHRWHPSGETASEKLREPSHAEP
jgi:hypothetical protein